MRRGRQLVLWPLLAALFGVVAAALVMSAALVLIQVTPESDEPWGDLGQIFLGLVLAVVIGVVVWVGGLARAARHLFAPGRRLGVGIWSALAILVVATALGVVGGFVDSDRLGDEVGRGLLGGGFVLMLAAPSGIFHLWDRRAGTRPSPSQRQGGESPRHRTPGFQQLTADTPPRGTA